MTKIFQITFIALFFSLSANAQNYTDALRFSQLESETTARALGVGGAFGAMGGDYASLNINPAGLADFRKSEFLFTPRISTYSDDASLAGGSPLNSSSSSFGIQTIGLIFSNNLNSSSWQTSNFAIGLSRVADFSDEFSFSGKNSGSITQRFLELAVLQGSIENLDNFESGLAWDVGALYADTNGNFITDFEDPDQEVEKKQYVKRSGKINQLDFAWAGNMNNNLNIGVSLGIPFFTFEETKIYEESDVGDEIPFFNNLEFTEFLNTSGIGINLKLGAVYKPVKELRIGAALHSPTVYGVDDSYTTSLTYAYNDNGLQSNTASSPDGTFDYRITTPWKAIGSLGTIFKAGALRGFVNGDIEYLNYQNNSFNYKDAAFVSDEFEANQGIDTQLTSAVNFRLGTEVGINIWRLRGGIAVNGSPYEADIESNYKTYSLGFGIRQDRFYLDAGYQISKFEEGYIPFLLAEEENNDLVSIDGSRGKILVTAGFKF